jgi:hypothetical protein
MMFSPENLGARRWLLVFLIAAALICVAILFRPWNSGRAPRPSASLGPVLSRPIEPAAEEALRRVKIRPNPAMQKAGPPDPVAQKRAATAAEKAAQAAAELAGTSTN